MYGGELKPIAGDGNDNLNGGEPATLPGDYGDGGAGIDQCINLETLIGCEVASLVQQQPLVGNATTTLGNVTGTPGGVGGDTTPPTVTVPNNMEVETDNPTGTSVTYNVRAVDNVDGEAVLESDIIRQDNVGGSITIACDPPSGSTFPVGVTTTVQCTAVDAAGNVGTASFTIRVNPPSTGSPLLAQEQPPPPPPATSEEEGEDTTGEEGAEGTPSSTTTEEGGEEPSPPPPPPDDTGDEGVGEPPPDEEPTTPPDGG
jgi:hypothetical protein